VQLSPEFLADFNRARGNGYAAQAAGLPFSGAYNPAVPGSQPLTLLPSLGLSLSQSAVVNNLQTNQVGGLADTYVQNVPGTRSRFLQNPGIYSSNALFNGGFSDYHSLQFEARRRFKDGFFGQLNYTWSDTNTDSSGTTQNRF
jgi:hypothetical protein